jgi:hypothetical protein
MASERTPLDISTIPELAHLATEVQRTNTPRLLRQGQEDLAVLMPLPAAPRRRKTGIVRTDDPLFRLIGIGRSGIAGGIAGKKHEALGRLRHT